MKGSAAVVQTVHVVKASYWSVTWFDAQAGVSYRLTVSNGATTGDFEKNLSAEKTRLASNS